MKNSKKPPQYAIDHLRQKGYTVDERGWFKVGRGDDIWWFGYVKHSIRSGTRVATVCPFTGKCSIEILRHVTYHDAIEPTAPTG